MKKNARDRRPENIATAISMPRDLMKQARERCALDERTFSEYVRLLIRRDVESHAIKQTKGHGKV
jgi:hypothetical protein